MTPGVDEDKLFIVKRGETDLRLDVPFHRPSLVRYIQRIDNHPAGVDSIRNLAAKVVDGPFGTQLKAEEYVEAGIPLIRVSDVRTGKIAKDALVYISPEKQADLIRSKVIPNDVVLTKAGAILGYAAVFPEELIEGNITSHSVLIRCQERVLPQFLAYFLRSMPGQRQIYRWGNKATRPELNTQEVKRIHVPLLAIERQREVVSVMEDGERRSEKLLDQAKQLLSSIDTYLLDALGIALPPAPINTLSTRIFTAQHRDLAGWRFDPQALHPEREACIAELQRRPSHPLRKAASFCRDLRTEIPEGAVYVGLENIEANTGRYVPSSDKESVSSAFAFRKGQVLFPKLRPYLNKVFLAPFDGLCSTEFHVLEGVAVGSEFLALFLRSQFVVKQTKHLMSGNTLPRLQTDDIEMLLIPEVDDQLQQRIVAEAVRRTAAAERLRIDAERELEVAKSGIEAMLLGESA